VQRWLRLAALCLAVAMLPLAAACGDDDSSSSSAGSGGSAAAKPGEGLQIGLVTDIGGLNDKSFNQLAYQGMKKAEADFGVDIRVLESKSDADYIPNLTEFADQGYDLIISNGFLMGEVTHEVAAEYPDLNFMIIDFAYSEEDALPNLLGVVFKEQEAGYLVGYMAGLMTESGTISSVGGQKIPPVDHYIAGYQAGAKASNPDIKLLNGYSNEFPDPGPCKEIALDHISKGADIVFQVAGQCGLGALDAAKEEGVWGIGVDADQLYIGDHVMVSAIKRVDVGVYDTIEQIVNGKYQGGVAVLGLVEDGVGIGPANPEVPADVVDETNAQIDKITSGEVHVPDTVP
jgi:basic membrane protein A